MLIGAFFEENQIEEPQAKAKAEAVLNSTKLASSVFNELIKGGALVEEQGQLKRVDAHLAKHRHKQVKKPPKVLRLTSIGSAALGAELAELERRHASLSEGAPWPRVAKRVGSARAGAVVVARGLGKVLEGCRQRVALADDLLRQARDAAVEANFTIRTLDKPLGEVSKRAWGLHALLIP